MKRRRQRSKRMAMGRDTWGKTLREQPVAVRPKPAAPKTEQVVQRTPYTFEDAYKELEDAGPLPGMTPEQFTWALNRARDFDRSYKPREVITGWDFTIRDILRDYAHENVRDYAQQWAAEHAA